MNRCRQKRLILLAQVMLYVPCFTVRAPHDAQNARRSRTRTPFHFSRIVFCAWASPSRITTWRWVHSLRFHRARLAVAGCSHCVTDGEILGTIRSNKKKKKKKKNTYGSSHCSSLDSVERVRVPVTSRTKNSLAPSL